MTSAAERLPRVLLVGPRPAPPYRGGVEKGVDILLRTELARLTEMRVFNNYRPHDPHRMVLKKVSYQVGKIRDFYRELERYRPDLVHVKTSIGVNFHQNALYSHAALGKGLPVVFQIHDGRFESFYRNSAPPVRAWVRATLRRATRVLVLSEHWADQVAAIAPGASIRIVPNGLEQEEILNLAPPVGPRPVQVLFMGTCERETTCDKGLEDLLLLLADRLLRYPLTRWVLAGLPDPDEVRRRLEGENLSEALKSGQVRLLGLVAGNSKLELIRDSTLLVLPSYYENMPNILLEAMAVGMSVVASRVGAVPDMMGDGEGAILVSPGDCGALGNALDKLLDSPFLAESMGRRNRRTLLERYSMAIVEEKLREIYLEAAGWPAADAEPALSVIDAPCERTART